MSKVTAAFNSISFDYEIDMSERHTKGSSIYYSLDGTAIYSVHVGKKQRSNYITGTGAMNSDTWDSFLTLLEAGTEHSLVTTFGTCNAILVELGRKERTGLVSGKDLYSVNVTFMRTGDYS